MFNIEYSPDFDPDHEEFLAHLKRVAAIVTTWPEWKRNVFGRIEQLEVKPHVQH